MILRLHNNNSPDRLALVDSTEIATVSVNTGGSIINTKGGGMIAVHESPEEILFILQEEKQ